MDAVKSLIAEAVQTAVREKLESEGIVAHDVEVQDIAPSEQMIRVKSTRRDGSASRYFRVKVSEVM